MVVQTEHHALLLGSRETLLKRLDHPGESLVVGVARQSRLDATVGHQFVEIFRRSPAACVDSHRGDAKAVGQVDRAEGFLDVGLPYLRVRGDKALVCREPVEIETVDECPPLELLQLSVGRLAHLHLENLHAIKTHRGRVVDAVGDRGRLFAKLPKRIGRHAEVGQAARGRGLIGCEGRCRHGSSCGE